MAEQHQRAATLLGHAHADAVALQGVEFGVGSRRDDLSMGHGGCRDDDGPGLKPMINTRLLHN